jgi:hypothetical protein
VKFLFDQSQTPYLDAAELREGFGASKSSGYAKSKSVRDLLGMSQPDPNWCLPSKMDGNPLGWMHGTCRVICRKPRTKKE